MNSLAIYDKFEQISRAAIALQKSGFFPDVKSESQAIVKVMAGAELGIPPFASMTGIHIIQGKPVLGANVLATLVKNDPRYDYRIKKCTSAECELEWYENSKLVGASSFTISEAHAAGLDTKDSWKKYPSDMLFARAISRGARRFAPGVFGGSPVYTPEEMGVDTDEEGFVEIRDVTPLPTPPRQDQGKGPIWDENNADAPNPLIPQEPAPDAGIFATVVGSDGVHYSEKTIEQLSHMVNSLAKKIKAAPADAIPEQIAEWQLKRDAAEYYISQKRAA